VASLNVSEDVEGVHENRALGSAGKMHVQIRPRLDQDEH